LLDMANHLPASRPVDDRHLVQVKRGHFPLAAVARAPRLGGKDLASKETYTSVKRDLH